MKCDGHHRCVWADLACPDNCCIYIRLRPSPYLGKKVTGILKQSDWIKDSNGPGGSTPAKYFFGIKVQTTCKALFWIRTVSRLFSDVRTRAESKPTTDGIFGPHNRKAN